MVDDFGMAHDDARQDIPRDQHTLNQTRQVLSRFEQIEGQFAQLNQGLAHLQRLATLGTLTATVVHEFNNLLTPIISYAQLAQARPDDAELSRKAHEKALAGAQRASQLCASLLGYTHNDASPVTADLRQTVESALTCLGRGLEKDSINLVLDLPDVSVAMPATSLEQVLVNLVLNARKAMTGGTSRGGTLSIRARIESGLVHIEVSDTGRGVPPEIKDRLFEPFVTSDPESTSDSSDDQRKGTGLGLCVCRDLVSSAGGRISFDSTPGRGTTFHLLIPLTEPMRKSA